MSLNIQNTVDALQSTFDSSKTRELSFRRQQLGSLIDLLKDNEDELSTALKKDLCKSSFESWSSEIGFVIAEIEFALKHLNKWVRPKKVSSPLVVQPAKSTIMAEPLGLVLIIGAWNYPIQLTFGPLVAAIAAGNCAVIKPSEVAEATSKVVAELLPKYLDSDSYQVIQGGVDETTALLACKFDHIFYTGSEAVAKIVMRAAANHLTPVTLELGGKSPCVVAEDCNWKVTSARIIWSKFMNAGQTCVCPDYIIVQRNQAEKLISNLRNQIHKFYSSEPKESKDYGRIINQRHAKRLASYLDGMNCVIGGENNIDDCYIAPTVVLDPPLDSNLMTQEIFGPILPIITVDDLKDAIPLIKAKPKPLAMYVYSADKSFIDEVIHGTSAGSVAINDGMMFMANPNLPFGGVGNSGMGRYHGVFGFETFSHFKSVIDRGTIIDPSLRYPPFNKLKLEIIKKIL